MTTEPMEEFIHHADGRLQSKDPLAPFYKVGTRVRIIQENKAIGITESRVGFIGVIGRVQAAQNKAEKGRNKIPTIWATYEREDGHDLWCYPEMLEVIE